jgi:hypothetical protein
MKEGRKEGRKEGWKRGKNEGRKRGQEESALKEWKGRGREGERCDKWISAAPVE